MKRLLFIFLIFTCTISFGQKTEDYFFGKIITSDFGYQKDTGHYDTIKVAMLVSDTSGGDVFCILGYRMAWKSTKINVYDNRPDIFLDNEKKILDSKYYIWQIKDKKPYFVILK